MSTKGSKKAQVQAEETQPLQMTRKQYEAHQREFEEVEDALAKLSEERRYTDFHLDHEGVPDPAQVDIEHREGILKDRRRWLRNILNSAVINTAEKLQGIVGIGSKVLLRTDDDEFEVTLVSVSPDVLNGEVSLQSPIGKAINGQQEGANIEYAVEGNIFHGKILKVT